MKIIRFLKFSLIHKFMFGHFLDTYRKTAIDISIYLTYLDRNEGEGQIY